MRRNVDERFSAREIVFARRPVLRGVGLEACVGGGACAGAFVVGLRERGRRKRRNGEAGGKLLNLKGMALAGAELSG